MPIANIFSFWSEISAGQNKDEIMKSFPFFRMASHTSMHILRDLGSAQCDNRIHLNTFVCDCCQTNGIIHGHAKTRIFAQRVFLLNIKR